ncbi:MAG: CXXX repeat peptide maturase [Tidjanibacter sp.]|nr:CXXX repeat peptide maturase [Tidjanibacter sp.]
MLKYLVIQLADDAASYCHYENVSKGVQFISVENLKTAIRFGMVENLNIQFIYPKRALPDGYAEIIETIDHTKIIPCAAPNSKSADIVVCNSIEEIEGYNFDKEQIVILRIYRSEVNELPRIYDLLKGKCARLNVVLRDVEKFSEGDFEDYKSLLAQLGNKVTTSLIEGGNAQLNLLTDRLVLNTMNNCNAGDEVVAIMPNGKFYPCAGFYYDNPNEDFGDLMRGVQIKKRQLFKLSYAPICRHCDAYHCRRCAWLNRKTTLEVNTPSHEQCVVAHLERNESGRILSSIREACEYEPETTIPEIDYLDPFEKRKEW